MKRRNFLGFLAGASVARALPVNALATLGTTPRGFVSFHEIVSMTLRRHEREIYENIARHNTLLKSLKARR